MFLYLMLLAADLPLPDLSKLEVKNAQVEIVQHQGSRAIRLMTAGEDGVAVLRGSRFRNGTIEMDVSGAPAKNAGEGARGFIGLNFRIQGSKWENIYIRPTNGRASDQLRRNHSTQYTSAPDWPWERLRDQSPGVYESYADMEPGKWIHLRIVVKGTEASLYVGAAEQPCLLVHDLKLGESEGAVALWLGPMGEGYFRNISITDR